MAEISQLSDALTKNAQRHFIRNIDRMKIYFCVADFVAIYLQQLVMKLA